MKTLSPNPQQRFENVTLYHIGRGFRDECARRERKLMSDGDAPAGTARHHSVVMAGLVSAIHGFFALKKDVDARDKRGHDD